MYAILLPKHRAIHGAADIVAGLYPHVYAFVGYALRRHIHKDMQAVTMHAVHMCNHSLAIVVCACPNAAQLYIPYGYVCFQYTNRTQPHARTHIRTLNLERTSPSGDGSP